MTVASHRAGAVLIMLVALLLPAAGCKKEPPKNWIAEVMAVAGKVKAVEGTPPQFRFLKQGHYLIVGAKVETGPKSQAVLRLRNGGELMVKPDSMLLFRTGKAGTKKVELDLDRGSVVGTGSKEVAAAELVIGVGGRKVRLTRSAKAQVVAPTKANTAPSIMVSYGKATVEGPSGAKEIVVAGDTLTLNLAPAKPDAAPPPPRPDQGTPVVVGSELVFFLKATGRGKVLIQGPTDKRPTRVRSGQSVQVVPDTRITLGRGARVVIGKEKGQGAEVVGPAQLVARAVPPESPGAAASIKLEREKGDLHITDSGAAGKVGSSFMVEGVRIIPRITYKRIDLWVRQGKGEAVVALSAGEAKLVGQGKTLVLQAGQKAGLSKGAISGPRSPAPSALQIRRAGTIRVFVSSPRIPLTLRWPQQAGYTLVEAARGASMARPRFSDGVRRSLLTLPAVPRGALHWRVRPLDQAGQPGKATRGKVLILKDTSHRRLKGARPPRNAIHERDGDTTVYYQNRLPRFTLRWNTMKDAAHYQVKVFRERKLTRPLLTLKARKPKVELRSGKLREGNHIWYVAGRTKGGKLVRTSKSRTLSIRYDNATPNLQITSPRNGQTVAAAQVEVRGVAIRGSRIFINGAAAQLDAGVRFTQQVNLRPGANMILVLVVHPRSGSSYYLRKVIRR